LGHTPRSPRATPRRQGYSSRSVGNDLFEEERVEKHLAKIFEAAAGNEYPPAIQGVSICWNFGKKREEVDRAAHRLLNEIDEEVHRRSQASHRPSTFPDKPAKSEEDLQTIKLLESIQPSGCAFVTMETPADCIQALLLYEAKGRGGWPSTKISLHPVHNDPEQILWPEYGRSWIRFGGKFTLSILVIFVSIPLLDAFAYAPNIRHLLYYHDVPLMNEGYFVNGMICGALCGALNVIISKVIEKMMYFSGFLSQSKCERWYLLLYFLAILINTIVDLSTFIISALGYSSVSFNDFDDPQHAAEERMSRMLSIADKPGVQHKVFTMIMSALPTTLLAGALAEPLGTVVFPLILNARLVVINKTGTLEEQKRYAEEKLLCDRFDERRSADIMVSVVLCTIMLMFTQHDLYIVFGYLFFFQVITYIWDHYRLLRCCTRTTFTSFNVCKGSCVFLCVPCALMAALLVGRVYHVLGVSLQEQYEAYLHNAVFNNAPVTIASAWVPHSLRAYFYSVIFTAPAAFVAHWLLHVLVMKFALRHFQANKVREMTQDLAASPKSEVFESPAGDEDLETPTSGSGKMSFGAAGSLMGRTSSLTTPHMLIPYNQSSLLINYFNSNPVHCLRSKFIFEDEPPMCPHEWGKEYLLMPTWNQKVKALKKKDNSKLGLTPFKSTRTISGDLRRKTL